MKAAIEGLLFVSGDEGITISQICSILNISLEEANNYIRELINDYNSLERGMQIKVFGEVVKMMTKEMHHEIYEKLANLDDETFLSQGALETLAIIAYNGPVTRLQIDQIRGVNSSYLIRKLLDREFIVDVGKSETPGRPTLYQVSSHFLDYFGLKSLDDLPKLAETEEPEEIDLFNSKYVEEN